MIDLSTLQTFEMSKDLGYIYFLFHDNQLIYIGQTTTLEYRVSCHQQTKHFTSVKYERCPVWNLTKREDQLIKHFNPILNNACQRTDKFRMLRIGEFVHVAGQATCEIIDGYLIRKDGPVVAEVINGRTAIMKESRKKNEVMFRIIDLVDGVEETISKKTKNGFHYILDKETMDILELENKL